MDAPHAAGLALLLDGLEAAAGGQAGRGQPAVTASRHSGWPQLLPFLVIFSPAA